MHIILIHLRCTLCSFVQQNSAGASQVFMSRRFWSETSFDKPPFTKKFAELAVIHSALWDYSRIPLLPRFRDVNGCHYYLKQMTVAAAWEAERSCWRRNPSKCNKQRIWWCPYSLLLSAVTLLHSSLLWKMSWRFSVTSPGPCANPVLMMFPVSQYICLPESLSYLPSIFS